jgi:polygalacturonase
MTQIAPDTARLSRRRFLALSATGVVVALAACGRQTAAPTVTPPATPTTARPLPSPTTAPTLPPATATAPPPAPTATAIPTATATATAVPVTPPPPAQMAVDVKQFGALGDGVTDDTAAIQAAIAAIPDNGGSVAFPPGTYLVTPTTEKWITIKSNLRLTGTGEQSVIKIRDHAGDWPYLFAPPDINAPLANVVVEDLTFDANIANNPEATITERDPRTYQTFIAIRAGRNLTVRRCRFTPYASVAAVSLNGREISECAVTDCTFRFAMRDDKPDYNNSAIYIERSTYTLSGNRFESAPTPYHEGRACMQAHGGSGKIVNNTATGYQTLVSIGAAYADGGPSSDIVCRDNTIADALIGIMLWPIGTNTLANVTVANNTIAVAQLKHGTADMGGICAVFSPYARGQATNLTITGNTIRFQDEGTGRGGDFWYNSAGIALHNLGGTNGAVIEGNTIELAPSAGVLIGLTEPGERLFQHVRVANNTIANPGQNLGFPTNARAGVLVTSNAADIAITGNTISDTFPTTRCPAAIAFDVTGGKSYRGITVKDNVLQSAGQPLPLLLPDGVQQ